MLARYGCISAISPAAVGIPARSPQEWVLGQFLTEEHEIGDLSIRTSRRKNARRRSEPSESIVTETSK